jgi:hypothetical protein
MTRTDSETGYELEAAGEFEAAATAYAQAGFALLNEAKFELGGERPYEGLGYLKNAISCDRRAGNLRRPSLLASIYRTLVQELRESTDDTVEEGLAWEWLGDLKILLGHEDVEYVHEHYGEADERFEEVDWRDELGTGEPMFEDTYRAIQNFSEYHDGPLPENPETVSFEERLELKRALAEQADQ